jgi:hypothetical protein
MQTPNITRVTELFSLFADLEGEELRRWHGLCEASARQIAARTRPDLGPDSMEELCLAAAGVAYSDYLALRGNRGGAVKVGDISLGAPDLSGGDAAALRAHFLARAAHLLTPECPALLAVGDHP